MAITMDSESINASSNLAKTKIYLAKYSNIFLVLGLYKIRAPQYLHMI